MVLGIIGIVIALAIFLYGAYRNVATLYLAPICGVIVAAFNSINLVEAFTNYHISGVMEMFVLCFPTIFLGAILGKIFQDCGAAASIANTLIKKFVMPLKGEKQVRAAVLIILLITCVMTFGGIDGFVAVFAIFPIVMIMAEKLNIPRRYVPAMLCLGSGANAAPGVPSIYNIVNMSILKTSSMAAAVPGYITFVVVEVGIFLICSTLIIRAMRRGEVFELGSAPKIVGDEEGAKAPNFVIAILPLVLVFLLFSAFRTSPTTAITAGIVLAIVLMGHQLPKKGEARGVGAYVGGVIESLNVGAMNGATAIMTITAAAGFAAVVVQTKAFSSFVGSLFTLPLPPVALALILMMVIVAFTSSPPAALSIALPIVAGAFVWVDNPIMSAEALARVGAWGVDTFATLPVNGLVLLTTSLAQVKIKEAYLPIFLQTCIMTTIGAILCAILVTLFPGLA